MEFKQKDCSNCTKPFNPSSRHRKCPACRAKERKKPCPQCSKLITRGSITCYACHLKNYKKENSVHWRGGKAKHSKGYVYVRADNHPRAAKTGYIFEHILVMEEILGRYLLPGENIHHLNGIRNDNRPENLELWCKPQPSGIRAIDAYRHALEVVERYKGTF